MTTPNLGVDLSGHPDVSQDFTYECAWGCEIRVERSVQQPHRCRAKHLVLEALQPVSNPATREHLAADVLAKLEPMVREQLGKACDPDHQEAHRGE